MQRCFLCFAYCCHCIVNMSCHVETCGALYRVQKLAFFSVFCHRWRQQNHRGKAKCLTWFACATARPIHGFIMRVLSQWKCFSFFFSPYLCDTGCLLFFLFLQTAYMIFLPTLLFCTSSLSHTSSLFPCVCPPSKDERASAQIFIKKNHTRTRLA